MEKLKEKKQEVNEKANAFALEKVAEEIRKINYGSVTVVIQEGKIVQIDTSTKIRLV